MPKVAYFSLAKLIGKVVNAFQEYRPERSLYALPDSSLSASEDGQARARFKVSVNDLKVISSALLYYKKFLIKKKDFDKAEVVAEVDDRIYRLILALEKEFLMEEEQVNA